MFRLNYCNCLFHTLPASQLNHIVLIVNATARIVPEHQYSLTSLQMTDDAGRAEKVGPFSAIVVMY
jgi:hypothetical protein